jgi:hypothetical protein
MDRSRMSEVLFPEVSAYSTVLPETAQGDPQEVPGSSDQKPNGWTEQLTGRGPEPVVDMKPQCVRKACNLPASPRSLTASCHLAHVPKVAASEAPRFRRYATTSRPMSRSPNAPPPLCQLDPISYFSCLKPRDIDAPPEKFRHSSIVTHIAMSHEPTSLGKPRQRAHRRRFARPPRFQNRAGLKDRGRRERLKKYTMRRFSQSI